MSGVTRARRGSLPHAEAVAANMLWLDHRVLLAEPADALDVITAICRIRDNAGAIKLRTGKTAQMVGRVAKTALRRQGRAGIIP